MSIQPNTSSPPYKFYIPVALVGAVVVALIFRFAGWLEAYVFVCTFILALCVKALRTVPIEGFHPVPVRGGVKELHTAGVVALCASIAPAVMYGLDILKFVVAVPAALVICGLMSSRDHSVETKSRERYREFLALVVAKADEAGPGGKPRGKREREQWQRLIVGVRLLKSRKHWHSHIEAISDDVITGDVNSALAHLKSIGIAV